MFIRVLHEYFNIPTDENILTPSDITDGTYTDLKYQTDAVQLALNSIKITPGEHQVQVICNGSQVFNKKVFLSTAETKIIKL